MAAVSNDNLPRYAAHAPTRRLRRIVVRLLVGLLVVAAGVRAAIYFSPGVGALLANTLRGALGSAAVTRLEEISADVEDRCRRMIRFKARPRTLKDVSPPSSNEQSATSISVENTRAAIKRPTDVGPMDSRVAAAEDGSWSAVLDPAKPREPALLFATLLHPDPRRPWAEVFIVAVEVARIRLYAVAGTSEPRASTSEGMAYARHGLIASEHRDDLLAAFNGGFRTEHGRHGMFVDGVTLVSAQGTLCTIVGFTDGALRIGTWKRLVPELNSAGPKSRVLFWRQAAPCMYEAGRLNPLLRDEDARNWGSTIDGNVVIRRSAVGLNADRDLLYVGISNDTTAPALAAAMHHAGASDVAQLDVNWSYPKFLLFPSRNDGRRYAQGLFKGFLFREQEYIERPSERDFFYLVRRSTEHGT